MTNIDIDEDIHKMWVKYYETQDQLEYPSLKNFTAKKLKEIIEKKR